MIYKRLEKIFDEQLDNLSVEDINELVQLMSLSDNECEKFFLENKDLKEKYFPEIKNQVFTIQEPKTETEEEDSSEEETSTYRVHQTNAGSSSYRKTYRKKNTEFSMPYHKGIPNSNNGSSTAIDTIKIDCIFDLERRKEVIDKWNTEISLIIQSNPEEFSKAKALLLLIEHKSAGIIQDFIKGTTWNEDLHGEDLFDQIINAIYMMFLGLDFLTNKDQENQKLLEKARQVLTKSQICDICLLDDFTCLFEQNLYKLSTREYHSWIEVYLMKIPIVGEKAKERWNKEKNNLTMHSLGFATRIVKEEIVVYCDLSNKQKQLKRFNKSCCKNLTEEPQLSFGCDLLKDKKYFKKKYKKKYKRKRRFWKTKKKRFSPGRYFSKEKPKICPQEKKKCRCWIYSEEGHYANECPNKQKFSEKTKLVLEAENEGYFPT
ncbi:hypothetical protein L1987_39970 [Smallanthus sonchifolius]|uniref:Uncharacterized protein n=1 Tax=Smallanthus sonchifolius TaxID=185202 RepID=A0ACB9GTD8_9ASTR|nr:hypothetical protein L1987_39970 [Smallanthus sonchifolius]